MFLKRKRTFAEKVFVCSLIMLHLVLILPLADVFPLPIEIARSVAHAEESTNRAPIIEAVEPIVKDEGMTVILQPVAYDPDGDAVSLSFESPFDESGIWQIPYDYTGGDATKSFETTVTASDGALQSSILVNITVNNVNTPPTVRLAADSYCVEPNTDFTLYIEAADGDGDILTCQLKEGDRVIDVPPSHEVVENLSVPGIYEYIVTVTDPGRKTATDSCYIEVADTGEGLNSVFPVSGDFNGDGLTDIGTFTKTEGSWEIALSDNGEFSDTRLWIDAFKGDNIERTYSITGDFNGDGKTDIGLFDNDGGTWRFAFSDGECFVYDSAWDVEKFGGGDCAPLTGDFNGDGATDIGYASPTSAEGVFCIKLAKEDRSGFEDTAISGRTGLGWSSTYSGDFNGDGLADILAFNRSTGDWYVMLAQDTASSQLVDIVQETLTTGVTTEGGPGGSYYFGSHRDTFDGNFATYYGGQFAAENGGASFTMTTVFEFSQPSEVTRVVAKGYNYSQPSPSAGYVRAYLYYGGDWHKVGDVINTEYGSGTLFEGEWSGVTKAKLESHGYSASLYTFTVWAKNYELQVWGPAGDAESNEGLVGFTSGTRWIALGFGANSEPVITDYNHDGKTDIGYFTPSTGQWHYALSDGAQFTEVSGAGWPTAFGQGDNVLPSGGDYNGDGIGDAAVFHRDSHGVLNRWEIKLHNSEQPDLLITIDNGIGGSTQIEYEASTRYDNTGDDETADLPFAVSVVKKLTKTDGMGNSYQVTYEYRDGMFEPDSREFRGFKYVCVTDTEGSTKETWFYQDDIYKGKPRKERVCDASGRVYSMVQYEWGNTVLYDGAVNFPHLVSKTSTL